MDKDLIKQSEKRLSKQRNKRLWWEIVILIALVVLAGTMRLMTGSASALMGDDTEAEEIVEETYDGVPVALSELTGGEVSLDDYITNVSANSYTYNESDETVSVMDLRIDFRFNDGSLLDTSSVYVFNCPEDIQIPKELLNPEDGGWDVYDMVVTGGSLKGYYRLVYDESSKRYQILAQFSGTPGDWVEGYVQFDAEFGSRLVQKTESVSIHFTDDYELAVDPREIKIPFEDVSMNYDLLVKKVGTEDAGNGRVVYTVRIYTLKGTPDVITVSDVLNDKDGMLDVSSFSMDSITKWNGTYNSTTMEDWLDCYDVSQMEEIDVSSLRVRQNGSGFTLELPGLSEAYADSGSSNRMYGEYYELKYSYALEEWDNGSKSANNQVTVSGEDVWTGKLVKDVGECSFSINHNKSCTLSKSGKVSGSEAVWTVNLNNTGVDLTDYRLTDTMFDQADAKGLTVKHADGSKAAESEYKVSTTSSGYVTGLVFCDTGSGNYNSYTITYKTSVEGSKESSIKNTVTLLDADGQTAASGNAGVDLFTIAKGRDGDYLYVDEDTIAQKWKTRLIANGSGISEGTRIFDYFNSDKGTIQYMTYRQMEKLYESVKGDWDLYVSANGGLLRKDYQDPDGAAGYTSFPTGDEDSKYYAFYLKAKHSIASPSSGEIVFAYGTTIDVSTASDFGATLYYINYAYIESPKEVSYGYTFARGGITKTDENGETGATEISNADGKITWKVKVAADRDNTYTKLIVTDQLPEGLTLSTLYLSMSKGSFSDVMPGEEKVTRTVGSSSLSCTYWVKDGEVHIEFDNGDNTLSSSDVFTITYQCVVDDFESIEAGESRTFENSALLQMGSKEIPSNTQKQTWTKEEEKEPDLRVLSKTGSWDNNKQSVKYSVVINPAGISYADGGMVELKDEMTIGRYMWPNSTAFPLEAKAKLNLDKVKLYYAEANKDDEGNVSYSKGEELDASLWSYTCGAQEFDGYKDYWVSGVGDTSCNRYTLNAKLPDATPLILEYEYNITGNFTEWIEYADSIYKKNWDSGTNAPPLAIDNTVELLGVQNTQTGEVIREDWKKSGTSGGLTECIYEIVKVESDNYGMQLSGAEFAIYKDGDDTPIDTRTTDSEGKIYIKFMTDKDDTGAGLFKEDTLYYIQETAAPEGYLIGKNPAKYYFYYASDDSDYKLPSDDKLDLQTGTDGTVINAPVNLWSANKRSIVVNTADVTSLTVEKRWQNASGDPLEHNYGTIHVRLYRVGADGTAEQVNYQGNETTTIDYDTLKSWKFTFGHLTRTYQDEDGNEQPYQYYVEEVGVDTPGGTANSTGQYLVSYSNEENGQSYSAAKDVATADGTIFITNKENTYELPATGGTGTNRYTYGGLLLLLLAGVYAIVYRCKKQHKQ